MFRVRVPAGFRVKIAAREPIVLGYMEDGVRKERTIWHPGDPVLFPPGRPRYWVPPKKLGLLKRIVAWTNPAARLMLPVRAQGRGADAQTRIRFRDNHGI